MTINLNTEYPARSDPADAGHPLGSAKDSLGVPGSGLPFSKILVDDWLGSWQAILAEGGITASGNGDVVGASDIVDALNAMITAGNPLLSVNVQTTAGLAAYSVQATDAGNMISMVNAAAQTVTIPVDTTEAIPVGAEILIEQGAAGQTDIVPEGGVTLQSFMSYVHFAGQYTTIRLIHKSLNTWLLVGDNNLVAPPVTLTFGCLNTMTYSGQSLNVGSIFTASCVWTRPDGLELYVADSGGFPVVVDRYTMTIARDLTTASLTSSSSFASAQSIQGIDFNPSGTRIYLTDEAAFGDEAVRQFDLAIAWDPGSAMNPVVFVIGPSVFDGAMSRDGSTFYVLLATGVIEEYNMPVVESIAGMTLTTSFNVDAAIGGGSTQAIWVNDDGSNLYALVLGSAGGDEIFQFDLTPNGSLSAPTLTGGTGLPFNTGTEEGTPKGLGADATTETFYTVGAGEVVYKYTTTATGTCP